MDPSSLALNPTGPQAAMMTCPRPFPLFVGGYGSGKTQAKIWTALYECLKYPGLSYGLYAPSFGLMKLSDIPRVTEWLDERNIKYDWHLGNYIFTLPGESRIIFRSIDRPETIVAYETHRAGVDEIDTLSKDKAEDVFNKIMARTRQKYSRDGVELDNIVRYYSTPEGYRFCYSRWGKTLQPGYALVRAPTTSNPYLPADYVPKLMENYSEQLVKAYVEGYFVNMMTGSVYPEFSRTDNHRDTVIAPHEPLHIGQDFNVNAMATIIGVLRMNEGREELHIVKEHLGMRDTQHMLETVKPYKNRGHRLIFYPDAAGDHRSTQDATKTDIALIHRAGYRTDNPRANPPVKDRVMTVNAMLHNAKDERHLFVNTKACPKLTEALEIQAYDNHGKPEKPTGPDDPSHPNDALGYLVHRRYGFNRPVFDQADVEWN